MRQEDLASVGEIESENLSPWSAVALQQELKVAEGMQLVVLDAVACIVGWCACRLVWPEAELLKIAVTSQERRKGIGHQLLYHLLRDLEDKGYTTLFLEVRAANKAAMHFYKRHGFVQIGRRQGYYLQPQDDALILRKDIC